VQGQHSLTCHREKSPLETLTDTLIERVDKLVQAGKGPLLSTTSTSVAIRELVARSEALENAVRDIALEVQKLAARKLQDGLGETPAGSLPAASPSRTGGSD
jgi:hypothetical protein